MDKFGQLQPMNVETFKGSPANHGNHTAIGGGRKPPADVNSGGLFKPPKSNHRGKFSNGGGSIGGVHDLNFEVALQGNGFERQGNQMMNATHTNFNIGNIMNDTQTRFMQQAANKVGGAAFQNNFLLPKPNQTNMIKTFYNSKQSTSVTSHQTRGPEINTTMYQQPGAGR